MRELLQQGKTVRGLILSGENETAIKDLTFERVYGDVRNIESLHPLFKDSDKNKIIVIHSAGIVTISLKYVKNVIDVNVHGTENMLELAMKYKVDKFIYVSSVHAISELPKNQVISEIKKFEPLKVRGIYAKSKAIATNKVLEMAKSGLNATIVHPSGIIGPNDYLLGHTTRLLIDYINGSLKATLRGGYDFVDVRDVVDGILKAVERGKKGECYILNNRYYSIQEILSFANMNKEYRNIKHILPNWFVSLIAPLAELYYKVLRKKPLFTRYTLYTLSSNSNFTHKKATIELGYKTRPMEETVKDTIIFLKEQNLINNSKI